MYTNVPREHERKRTGQFVVVDLLPLNDGCAKPGLFTTPGANQPRMISGADVAYGGSVGASGHKAPFPPRPLTAVGVSSTPSWSRVSVAGPS